MQDSANEPAGRSSAPESGPHALTRQHVGFRPPEKSGAWEARGWVCWLRCFEKVADLLFALLMMWSVSEKVPGKSRRKISSEKC